MVLPHINDIIGLAFGATFVLLVILLVAGIYWRAKYGPAPKVFGAVLPPLSSQHPFIQQPKAHEPCDSLNC